MIGGNPASRRSVTGRMNTSRLSLWIVGGLLVIGVVAFVATSRAGYETARYEVLESEGAFDLRRYEPLTVVKTSMKEGGQNGSFGRLFQYISGKNAAEQKIEMTTPVFMPGDTEGNTGEMQFVVPEKVATAGAPAPADGKVSLDRMEGGVYAVIRFKGVPDTKDRRERLGELRAILAKRGLTARGEPIFAGYDPPWTPGPLRRNEVLLRVEER